MNQLKKKGKGKNIDTCIIKDKRQGKDQRDGKGKIQGKVKDKHKDNHKEKIKV